jgi:hypothetical protein
MPGWAPDGLPSWAEIVGLGPLAGIPLFSISFFFYFLFSAGDLYLNFKFVLDGFEFMSTSKSTPRTFMVHFIVL